MPTVNTYGGLKVKQAPLPGATRQAHETYASAGGTVAEAQGQFGATVVGVALPIVTAIQAEERDKADATANLRTRRLVNEQHRNTLMAPDTGFLTLQGQAPHQVYGQTLEQYDAGIAAIGEGLKTDKQRLFYAELKERDRDEVRGRMDVHANGEDEKYAAAETEATVESSIQRAADAAADPDPSKGHALMVTRLVAGELAVQRQIVTDAAARLGWGPEVRAAKLAAVYNQTWTGAIKNQLAQGHDITANTWRVEAAAAGQLTGKALTEMTAATEGASTLNEAARSADAIWTAMAPGADDDETSISIDKLETRARELYPDDAKMQHATIAALRTRKDGVEDGRRERRDKVSGDVWGTIASDPTLTLEQVSRMPSFIDAPGKFKMEVLQFFDREADERRREREHQDARVDRAEGRASAAENREARRLEIDGAAEYFRLSQPEELRKLTQGQVVGKLKDIGRRYTGLLLNEWEARTKTDAALRAHEVDADLFKTMAQATIGYGGKGDKTLTKAQQANLGKLQIAISDAVGDAAFRMGHPPTLEEQRTIMQRVMDDKVYVQKDFWYDEQTVAVLLSDENRAKAYQPLADIPPAIIEEYASELRKLDPTLAKATTSELVKSYGKRMEAAHAQKLRGAKNVDIRKALLGK